MNIIAPAFDASTFSKNKERLLEHEIARQFLGVVLDEARQCKLLSEDHFTVDGTLLEAWASLKSFRSKDGSGSPPADGEKNPEVDFTVRSGLMILINPPPTLRLYWLERDGVKKHDSVSLVTS